MKRIVINFLQQLFIGKKNIYIINLSSDLTTLKQQNCQLKYINN